MSPEGQGATTTSWHVDGSRGMEAGEREQKVEKVSGTLGNELLIVEVCCAGPMNSVILRFQGTRNERRGFWDFV